MKSWILLVRGRTVRPKVCGTLRVVRGRILFRAKLLYPQQGLGVGRVVYVILI